MFSRPPGLESQAPSLPPGRFVPRDPLPIPAPVISGVRGVAGKLSRGCCQRRGRRRAISVDSSRCLSGLNFLHGGPIQKDGPASGVVLSKAQSLIVSHVRDSVRELGAPPGELTAAEALRKLRLCLPYNQSVGGPVSYDPSRVSLPEAGTRQPGLAELWGDGGDSLVEQFVNTQVLPKEVASKALADFGPRRPYGDPVLHDSSKYSDFLKALLAAGVIEISSQPARETVDVFFVGKDGGRQRMVVDCRRSNRHFSEPAPVSLASGDSIAALDTGAGSGLVIGQVDIRDAFYRMALPEALRPLFCLRPIRAGALGLSEVDGRRVPPQMLVRPRLRVLPMGWSWALWWCQAIHERAVEACGLPASARLSDGVPCPPLTAYPHFQYVDNFCVFGPDREGVEIRLNSVCAELEARGLPLHKREIASERATILGWELDAQRHRVRPQPERVWRVRLAIRELLRLGFARAVDLERVLGHICFISLIRREVLSIFKSSYRFVEAARRGGRSMKLWSSVKRELGLWDDLAPLLWRSTAVRACPDVVMVDASPWGLGAVRARVDPQEAAEAGRQSERWRLRGGEAARPREKVVMAAARDVVISTDGPDRALWEEAFRETFGVPLAGPGPRPQSSRRPGRHPFDLRRPLETPEVPWAIIDSKWKICGRSKWSRPCSSMPVLEGEAMVYGVRHLLRSTANFGSRLLVLGDSLTVAFATAKGRSSSDGLLMIGRRLAGLLLATGCTLCVRWLASELNAADAPSRGRWQPSDPRAGLRAALDKLRGEGRQAPAGRASSEQGERERSGSAADASPLLTPESPAGDHPPPQGMLGRQRWAKGLRRNR